MKVLDKWREATENLTKVFTKRYFPNERYGKDTFWVGDEIGDIYFVSDMFFDVDRMRRALEFGATFEHLNNFHQIEMEAYPESPGINFENFVKYGLNLDGHDKVDV